MPAVVYCIVDSRKNAKKIARDLVEKRLVACVNIVPKVDSIYRWKGKVEEAQECLMIAKTVDTKVIETIQRIKTLHTYEVPAITVLPIIGGLKEYLEYLQTETA